MTDLALVAALAVFRVATALLLATGMGSCHGRRLVPVRRGRGRVGRERATLAAQVAAVALVAAALSWRRVPLIAEIRRRIVQPEPNHPAQVVFLIGLAIGAALQVPFLLAWFREDRALLLELLGTRPDPLRLDLVPGVILDHCQRSRRHCSRCSPSRR